MKTTPFSQETFVGFKIQNLWIANEEDSFEYWNLRLNECETVLTIPRVFFFLTALQGMWDLTCLTGD